MQFRAPKTMLIFLMVLFTGGGLLSCSSEPQEKTDFPRLEVGKYFGTISGKVKGNAGSEAMQLLYLNVVKPGRFLWAISGAGVSSGVSLLEEGQGLTLSAGSRELRLTGAQAGTGIWKGVVDNGNGSWRVERLGLTEVSPLSPTFKETLEALKASDFDLVSSRKAAQPTPAANEPAPTVAAQPSPGTSDTELCKSSQRIIGHMESMKTSVRTLIDKRLKLNKRYANASRVMAPAKLVALGRLILQREGERRRRQTVTPKQTGKGFRAERAAALQAEIEAEKRRIEELRGG